MITVSNGGDVDALDTTLFDPIPTGLVFLPPLTGDCASTFPCTLGTLAPGGSRTVTAKFLVPVNYAGPDLIQNTASATTSSPESVLDNNHAICGHRASSHRGLQHPAPLPDRRHPQCRRPAWAVPPSPPASRAPSTCARPAACPATRARSRSTSRSRAPPAAGDLRLFAGGRSRRSPRPSTTARARPGPTTGSFP